MYSRYSSGLSGRIFHQVSECPGITRRELADKLGVTSPTVTRAVRNIYKENFIILVRKRKCIPHFLSHSECNMGRDNPCLIKDN
ncbi:winged helix-turn-helix transcriptional regulator [Methanospirillum lacunae]|uniref:winged helix-turn-helix transcriptional regulator n=1 Tax=Methanospirillum lacunae TaxID=668570 RepID=UPI0015E83175